MSEHDATRSSYNRLAAEYARRMADELAHKPLDRQLLDAFASATEGLICDLGCGPGQVAGYLYERGCEVVGVDLSDAMVEEARRLHPGLRFLQADMRQLPFEDGALGGIVAFYSLIHLPTDELPVALRELRRVLREGGSLLVTIHCGSEVRHFDTLWDEPVNLDFRFFTPQAMRDLLMDAGFTIVSVTEREPYPEVEVETQRAYLLATVPTQR
ncbi:MAG TPA: class I SAM-dependent methyltransferase [Ktedonobacterales bacterium]